MFNGLQPWHIILIVVALILIFGAKKLPEAARGLGRSMRILKSEVNAMHEDGTENGAAGQSTTTAAATQAPPAIAPVAPAVTTPMTAAPAAAAQPVPAAPASAPASTGSVQATTIDGKPAVIINGVPTLIDNQAT